MGKVSVVIGAGYGDEGKGLTTDYLSNDKTTVVRFNGGAQAGHTVTTPEGVRHIFHHFGSGTLRGAATHLSKFFICNPIFFREEWEQLEKLGITPKVSIDPRAMITLPFDMFMNKSIEEAREKKHGTCGHGINETMVRQKVPEFSTTVADLKFKGLDFLKKVRREWVPRRAEQLGLTELKANAQLLFLSIENHYIEDLEWMLSKVHLETTNHLWHREGGDFVFEGAQGLQLDMDSPNFPHVTHSKTGLHNVLRIMEEAKIWEEPEVFYVSRIYATRHGAGPLKYEQPKPDKTVDLTNVPNPFQGTIRYGMLDLHELFSTIQKDLVQAPKSKANMVWTCLDQCNDDQEIPVVYEGVVQVLKYTKLYELTRQQFSIDGMLTSRGPTRSTMEDWRK